MTEPNANPTTGPLLRRLSSGSGYMLQGFSWPFSKHPKLLVWVAIPALVNMLLFGLFVWLLAHFGGQVVDSVSAELSGEHPWYLAWVYWIVEALLWLVVVLLVPILAFVTVYLLGNLVAAPFNDLLSEKVEAIRLGSEDQPFSVRVLIADLGFTVGQELLRLSFFVTISLLLLLLHLIPVIGSPMNLVVGGWFAFLFFSLEYVDLPMARRRHRFSERWGVVWSNKALCTGFGGAAALFLWVPLLNFVCMPAAVVGGTLLYADLVESGRLERRPLPGAAPSVDKPLDDPPPQD